jgi:hypothetical protein
MAVGVGLEDAMDGAWKEKLDVCEGVGSDTM